MSAVIKVENLSKKYKLGMVSSSSLAEEIHEWWDKLRGKEQEEIDFFDNPLKGKIHWALKDISFEIKEGEVLGIIGRNGAGKSTLLKILSKVTTPTSGRVKIKGRIASLLEVGTGFHGDLSGRENIYLNGAILGMNKREIDKKYDEIVDFSGVEKFIDTPVKRYSSGMYVRLAFAVAAHLDPDILIIDEVLAVGDMEFQKKCLGKMKEVSSNYGRTVLFVSHQLGMIKSLCNNAILLNKGTISYVGDTHETINKYLLSSQVEVDTDFQIPIDESLPAQITHARLVNEKGELQSEFDVFERKFLEINLTVRRNDFGFIAGFLIEKNGEDIIGSHENDFDADRLNPRQIGEYKLSVELPTPLKAGSYTFKSIGLGVPNREVVQTLPNMIQFQVSELSFDPSLVSFSKNREGVIVATHRWNITKVTG